MNHYLYDGPVMEFGKCVQNHLIADTYAISEKKARSNIEYQYKKEHGKVAKTPITLPGDIIQHY